MTTNVHTTYTNVQGQAGIALVSCHHVRQPCLGERVGRWDVHRLPWWTLVWSGAHGYQARIPSANGDAAVVNRLPRSWALHRPNHAFHERIPTPDPDRELLYLFFTISGSMPPVSSRPLTIVLDHDDHVAGQIRAMHHAQERGAPGDALKAHGLLLSVMSDILVCAHDGGDGSDASPWRIRQPGLTTTTPDLLAAVDVLVSRQLASPPSRDALAEALKLSVSSLAHRFTAETGTTLVERIRWLRIREAKLRLAEPLATVKTVAQSLGFSSAAYFSRVFKDVAGVTPEEYQRRCR